MKKSVLIRLLLSVLIICIFVSCEHESNELINFVPLAEEEILVYSGGEGGIPFTLYAQNKDFTHKIRYITEFPLAQIWNRNVLFASDMKNCIVGVKNGETTDIYIVNGKEGYIELIFTINDFRYLISSNASYFLSNNEKHFSLYDIEKRELISTFIWEVDNNLMSENGYRTLSEYAIEDYYDGKFYLHFLVEGGDIHAIASIEPSSLSLVNIEDTTNLLATSGIAPSLVNVQLVRDVPLWLSIVRSNRIMEAGVKYTY